MGRWRGIAAAAPRAAALGACSPPPPKVVTVAIKDMAYAQPTVDVHPGDTVRWVNQDIFVHSVTAVGGAFDLDLQVGGSGQTVFRHAGEVDYYCRYHPGMKGRVLVTD